MADPNNNQQPVDGEEAPASEAPDLLDPEQQTTDPQEGAPEGDEAPDYLDDHDDANVPRAPGEDDDEEDDDSPKDRGYKDDDEFESTPFEDAGGFDDKKDDDSVELFDDDGLYTDSDGDDEEEPLAAAADGKKKKKKKRTLFKKKTTTTTEKEPSKAEKRRRRRALCLLICCCCLIIILIILLLLLVFKDDEDPQTPVDDDSFLDSTYVDDFFGFGDGLIGDDVQTTPFDPYVKGDCDFSDNFQPHVISQCECYGKISVVADDIRELYTLLKTKLMPELYTEKGTMWDEPITSCDARNQALLWLSSGDTRRSGDLVQRFLTVTAYISMNGTKWDYQNNWLSDRNECLWLGLQCNRRFQIHTLALDTINIFGTVSAWEWQMVRRYDC